MIRAMALRRPTGLLARAMSSKLVATVTGPADKDALSTFTRTIMGQGVTLGGSRSMEVSGTLSIASVLFLPDKLAEKGAIECVSALQWALQANLAGFIVSVRPARQGKPPKVFARVHVSGAERMGILAELASHCESRGVRVATMRTQTDSSRYGADGIEGNDDNDEPLYTCVCTLATHEVRPAPLRALGVTPGPSGAPRLPPPAAPSPLGLLACPCARGPRAMQTWLLGCSGGAESMWAMLCVLTEARSVVTPCAALHLNPGHGARPPLRASSHPPRHPHPALALPSPGHAQPAITPSPPTHPTPHPTSLGRPRLPTKSTHHPVPCTPHPAPRTLHPYVCIPAPPSGGRGCRVDPSGALRVRRQGPAAC